MRKLVYSPDYRKKILQIKSSIIDKFGEYVCINVMSKITKRLHSLQTFENAGFSVREVYNVDTDYRCIYVMHNYIFYTVDSDYIYIVNIYNEKEDFILKLFGVKNIH